MKREDINELYDVIYAQIQEDREDIVSAYNDLKSLTSGSLHAFAASGDTLAKFAELRIKQGNQIIELLKVAKKDVPNSDNLTSEDYKKIADAIENNDES